MSGGTRRGALLIALACALAHAASAQDALTPIEGTGVELAVPEGFRVSEEFSGIGRDADLTSLLVTELAVPIEISRASFDAEGLARSGVRVDHIVTVEVDGRTGWLAHASQHAAGVTFRKWILLFGDESGSVMLTATTPLDLEALHQRALVEALRSARWTPQRDAADATRLPFQIAETGALRILRSSANALVLSDPDAQPLDAAPLVTVGASRASVQIGDLPAFARERLAQSPSLEAIEIEREGARSLDGMPGHEIHAQAREVTSGRSVAVTQLLASDGTRYFLVQAVVDATQSEAFAPRLERLIASFRRTSGP